MTGKLSFVRENINFSRWIDYKIVHTFVLETNGLERDTVIEQINEFVDYFMQRKPEWKLTMRSLTKPKRFVGTVTVCLIIEWVGRARESELSRELSEAAQAKRP